MFGRTKTGSEIPPGVENEADWWQARYKELEKNRNALQKQIEDMQFRHGTQMMRTQMTEDDTTVEDILTRMWKRGIEAVGAFSFILFLLQIVNQGVYNLSMLGQVTGAVTFVAVYETYLRPHLPSQTN